ncbi:hypothetical protein FSARC_5033 [Fusarium sarcochroum]|uniref:Uncharacterized protein n=1 Tax=Fusarium sarcochroum TaxID=1208366 RepID=A0A8H4U0W2_9HYPO|nr:hypothetical protein FSARC_5033 [Fusarium sarcochroum]
MDSTNRYSELPEVVVSMNDEQDQNERPPVPPKLPVPTDIPVADGDRYERDARVEGSSRRTSLAPVLCCVCQHSSRKAWNCVYCDDSFCDECWLKERPHRPGKVGIDGRPHEKVDEEVVRRLKKIFNEPTVEEQYGRHRNDIDTTWFGAYKEKGQLFLNSTNRLADILCESQKGAPTDRFPQLVSFVGQAGSGKSTVIKMLIDHQQAWTENPDRFLTPVPGLVGDNMPTTGDVHLYEEPKTYLTQSPIFYADCEGMTGGEQMPRGLARRGKVDSTRDTMERTRLVKKPHKIRWANQLKMGSREFAVKSLFPRILYTFSGVVVFVIREVSLALRTFETEVLTQLVHWVSMSIDESINQPTLPHVVIVANDTDPSIDDKQWDHVIATNGLLKDYDDSAVKVPALTKKLVELTNQGKPTKTTKALLEHYYSSVTLIRIPAKSHYMQIDQQIGKLYGILTDKCKMSHDQKRQVRMLLNAEVLPLYVDSAYDHFSRSIEEPFDFVEEARRRTPVPRTFGRHILNLILTNYNHKSQKCSSIRDFFTGLSRPLAACVMLDAIREKSHGTYSNLLRHTYCSSLQEAMEQFCDKWLRCSHIRDGQKCQNTRNSHKKGHQAISGKVIARGPYETTFIADEFFSKWINEIDEQIYRLDTHCQQSSQQGNAIPRILSDVIAQFNRKRPTQSKFNCVFEESF